MADYIELDIEDDPAVLTDQITDVIAAAIPNWVPFRTSLVFLLAAGTALIIAELMQAMRTLTRAIFSIFGREIAGVAQTEATPSTATATFTSTTLAFTVEAGTLVTVDDGAGGAITFEVVADVSTTDGSAEGVQLVSQEVGAYTAGLTLAEPGEALAYDPVVTLTAATSGGTDAETDDEYLPRLSERLQLLADRVIRGEDAAILARQVPGVHRALAIDNFEPPSDSAAEGHITVALQAAGGGAVGAGVATEVQELLDASSILGLTINLVPVTAAQVKVSVTGVAYSGYDEADVEDRVEAAIEAFLDPATWGSLPFGDVREWRTQPVVRYLELAQAVNAVDGFDYITTLQVALQAGTLGTSDVTLGPEPWVVAEPGTISATVAPPA